MSPDLAFHNHDNQPVRDPILAGQPSAAAFCCSGTGSNFSDLRFGQLSLSVLLAVLVHGASARLRVGPTFPGAVQHIVELRAKEQVFGIGAGPVVTLVSVANSAEALRGAKPALIADEEVVSEEERLAALVTGDQNFVSLLGHLSSFLGCRGRGITSAAGHL